MMSKERRYDLDWIRVIVFDILILYHVGMFFVPWGWHIKNNEQINWLQYPMEFVSHWRLPILFVISGMGTRFALSRRSGKQYILERLKRLFIPLITGILIVVTPQVYLERLDEGSITGSLLEFFPKFFHGLYPEGNFSWHHLWFLPYLLVMSVIATPLFIYLRKENNKFIHTISKKIKLYPWLLFGVIVPLYGAELLAPYYPVTHALIGDWYTLSYYFVLFITGFILISLGDAFWQALNEIRRYVLFIGVLLSVVFMGLLMHAPESLFYPVIKTINAWSWILVILAYGARYLNRESSIVKYRNEAVYPFYILHQGITIIIGFWLKEMPMHYGVKMLIMITGTFFFSWVIYEWMISKVQFIRPLFGLKNPPSLQNKYFKITPFFWMKQLMTRLLSDKQANA
jgi:hypothetical protein